MTNINRVTMIGQLTANPEVKRLPSGHVLASCRIATNYSWKEEDGTWKSGVDYHPVVAWDNLGEQLEAQPYVKGTRLFVEGKLRTRSWVDKEGNKRFFTEIVASTILAITGGQSNEHQKEENHASKKSRKRSLPVLKKPIPFLEVEEGAVIEKSQ